MCRTLRFFLEGALVTISMTGIATVGGLILALFVAIGRIRGGRFLSPISLIYVTCTRGVPLLIQIFIVYYGLNQLIRINPFLGGTLALAICTAGYLAEVIRAGIMSVDPGQQEAAVSLGLSYAQAMRVVILPQALRNALPGLGNEFITLLKASSLASAISVVELTRVATQLKSGTYKPIEMYLNAALLYLLMTMIFTYGVHFLERRWGAPRQRLV
jgi:polar amino acid transport system permease protein